MAASVARDVCLMDCDTAFETITPTENAASESLVEEASEKEHATSFDIDDYPCIKTLRSSLFGKVCLVRKSKDDPNPLIAKISSLKAICSGVTTKGTPVIENPIKEAAIMKVIPPHPNIVPLLHEVCRPVQKFHAIVMPYISGGELFDFLCKNEPNEATARTFFFQMVCALKHLHDNNVCHLDVSLENFLLDSANVLKLCDFGVARVCPPGKLFPPDIYLKPGKTRYMAPEIMADKPYDGKVADVWSLGVCLSGLLTGNMFFHAARPNDRHYVAFCSVGVRQYLKLSCPRQAKTISDTVQNLLENMFNAPDQRISVDQILQHKWFTIPLPSSKK